MAETVRCAGSKARFEKNPHLSHADMARGRHLSRRHIARCAVILPLLVVLFLAACGPGATATPDLSVTPTPSPKPEYLTYIGRDGNVWQLSLPSGSAVQLTTDAHGGAITYSGLAWSPNGQLLAVLRVAHSGQTVTPQLVVLHADGQVILQAPLLAVPYGHPFTWSPNSRYVAFRILISRTPSPQALLVLLDASSGALHKTLTYPFQQDCSGSRTALHVAIDRFHQAGEGIDTFAWAPDGNAILASAGCSNVSSLHIDLPTGAVTPGYPGGAAFQPGGDLLLGVWSGGSNMPMLGLRDGENDLVRDLTTESVPSPAHYPILAGEAIWTADGTQIYYEHADGIWHIGADGNGVRAIVNGSALDSQHAATVEMAPAISPSGRMLVYCELAGADTPTGGVTFTWYLAAPDGSNPAVLPDVTTQAIWQPLS